MKNETKELLSQLQSSSDKKVLSAIASFRKSGTVDLLPEFIDVVLSSKNDEVIRKGTQVLYDTKDEKAVAVIFKCLKDDKYEPVLAQLTAVLWEAGMNCDDRLEDLVKISIKGDTNTVLEVLTVIENMDTSYSFDDITELKMNIVENTEESDDELKNQLLNSLCQVLDGMIG
ncbi:MAG: folylpolyglutamate synthase/dihydropteroate synthase [Saprospiraceae bacterium]|jgi:folylpolyglutamate synthase/dihydropteroate synthase